MPRGRPAPPPLTAHVPARPWARLQTIETIGPFMHGYRFVFLDGTDQYIELIPTPLGPAVSRWPVIERGGPCLLLTSEDAPCGCADVALCPHGDLLARDDARAAYAAVASTSFTRISGPGAVIYTLGREPSDWADHEEPALVHLGYAFYRVAGQLLSYRDSLTGAETSPLKDGRCSECDSDVCVRALLAERDGAAALLDNTDLLIQGEGTVLHPQIERSFPSGAIRSVGLRVEVALGGYSVYARITQTFDQKDPFSSAIVLDASLVVPDCPSTVLDWNWTMPHSAECTCADDAPVVARYLPEHTLGSPAEMAAAVLARVQRACPERLECPQPDLHELYGHQHVCSRCRAPYETHAR